MGLLSSALLTELRRRSPEIAWLFEFEVGGSSYRFSDASRPSAAGLYDGRIVSWGGSLARGVDPFETLLAIPQGPSPTIEDSSRRLTTLLYGPLRHQVRRAPATITLASPNVDPGDWYSWSYIIETTPQPSQLLWSFQLGLDALALKRDGALPKATISVSDWPAAPVEVRDLPMPILYGHISSENGANNGAVTCYLVDATGFRYLVCAGRALAIDTVYKDGVPVAASSYSISYPIVNGRQVTLIDFTATQGSSTITCDAQGYDTVGDGTGTLIEDPAAVIQHLLVNWIYGDWRSGPWLSTSSAPVDTTSFGTTFFSDRGYKASVYIGGTKRQGLTILNELLKSFEARACWTPEGKIALVVEDFTSWSYATAQVLREKDCTDWSLLFPVAQIVDEIEARWAQTPTAGYTERLNVKDLGTGEGAPDEIELPYSPAHLL